MGRRRLCGCRVSKNENPVCKYGNSGSAGEYGAIRRLSLTDSALTLHLASRAYWNKYITRQARATGMLPFYWDEGSLGDNGFGIINRQNNTVGDQQVLDALVQATQ